LPRIFRDLLLIVERDTAHAMPLHPGNSMFAA
jgi:hypothetical protein